LDDYLKNVRDYLYIPNSNPCEKDLNFYKEFAFIQDTIRKKKYDCDILRGEE